MEKVNASAAELQLPVPAWEEIFKHLNFDQLKQSRSTCRYWKAVIDGSHPLMKRFHLVFPEGYVLDRFMHRPPTIPARSVTFERCRISCVDSWWTIVGEKLIHLTVKDCQMSFPTLQKMLERTPKLERLDYLCGKYPAVCISEGAPLEKLRHLTVDNPCMDVLDAFGTMCPNLVRFSLLQQSDKKKVLTFLKGKKETLREVELTTLAYSLNVLLQIKGLTGLYLVHEVTSDEILCIIGRGLPQLKSIAVKMTKNAVLEPSFLATMPKLESLSITSRTYRGRQMLNLGGFANSKLKHLSLAHVEVVGSSLKQYLSNSPNFSSAKVDCCHFDTWDALFTAVDQPKKLRRLEIMRTTVREESHNLFEMSDSLEHFILTDVSISESTIKSILVQCCRLKEVHLKSLRFLSNEVIFELMYRKQRLEKLTIVECKISRESVRMIEKNFLEVRIGPENIISGNRWLLQASFFVN